jgi:hypothetical protein
VKVSVQYQFKIPNTSEVLKNVDDSWEINWAWENIKETIGISDKRV